MGLDRDELAARFAVGAYSNCHISSEFGSRDDIADAAVNMADALLAALSSKPALAPPPAAEPPPIFPTCPTCGKAMGRIQLAMNIEAWRCDSDGRLHPFDLPPAAAPVAYVPKVGDVVDLWAGTSKNTPWVVVDADKYEDDRAMVTLRHGLSGDEGCYSKRDLLYARPATPAERAAAGLPVEPVAAPVEAKRPTHVRVTEKRSPFVTLGKVYAVARWTKDGWPVVVQDDGVAEEIVSSLWEPCAPPSPEAPDARGEADRPSRVRLTRDIRNIGRGYEVLEVVEWVQVYVPRVKDESRTMLLDSSEWERAS